MIATLLVFASIATVAHSQVVGMGACPTVAVMNTIDNQKFSGKWFAYERYNAFFDTGKCVSHNFMDLTVGHILSTQTTDVSTNVQRTLSGISAAVGSSMPGMFLAVYPTLQIPIPIPFNVVNTDYTSYAVCYTCLNLNFAHIKFAWVLTRDKIPSAAATTAAYGVMDWAKIDRNILQKVDQTCV